MTERTDKGLNLINFVFDDSNQDRRSWKRFGQTGNRSLAVFLSQFFCYTRNFCLLYSTNNNGFNV